MVIVIRDVEGDLKGCYLSDLLDDFWFNWDVDGFVDWVGD